MKIINVVLEILAIVGIVVALCGDFLTYFIAKYQKLGKVLLYSGLISIFLVIILSLVISIISG